MKNNEVLLRSQMCDNLNFNFDEAAELFGDETLSSMQMAQITGMTGWDYTEYLYDGFAVRFNVYTVDAILGVTAVSDICVVGTYSLNPGHHSIPVYIFNGVLQSPTPAGPYDHHLDFYTYMENLWCDAVRAACDLP